MANFASSLKSEVARLARKEVRAQTDVLRKAAAQQRGEIAALKRQLKSLQTELRGLGRKRQAASPAPEQEDDGGVRRRFSAKRLATMRTRLGLSAQDFGTLVGVTGQSIYKWEAGAARPRASQLEAIAAVRAMGKRDIAQRLAAVTEA